MSVTYAPSEGSVAPGHLDLRAPGEVLREPSLSDGEEGEVVLPAPGERDGTSVRLSSACGSMELRLGGGVGSVRGVPVFVLRALQQAPMVWWLWFHKHGGLLVDHGLTAYDRQ